MRGYAYSGAFRTRSAYKLTRETSLYLAPDVTEKGLGTWLYGELLHLLHLDDVLWALPRWPSVTRCEMAGAVPRLVAVPVRSSPVLTPTLARGRLVPASTAAPAVEVTGSLLPPQACSAS